MLPGIPQSAATLPAIPLFYAMDFVLIRVTTNKDRPTFGEADDSF